MKRRNLLSLVALGALGCSDMAPGIGLGLGIGVGLGNAAAAYNFLNDPQWIGRWEAGSFADQANGPLGPLVETGGSVTTTAGVIDGNPTWDFTKASGIRLLSTNVLSTLYFQGPVTCIVIAQATGSPAIGDRLLDMQASNGDGIAYFDATHLMVQDGSNGLATCTPTNFNCLTWYSHSLASRFAIGNAAFTAYAGNVNGFFSALALGANRNGGSSGSWRVAAVYLIEGQPSAQLSTALWAYLHAKFPSVVPTVTPKAQFSVDQISRGALPAGAFDIILVTGQSNNGNNATGTAPQAPAANTYQLDHDNIIYALKQVYDAGTTGYLDPICKSAAAVGGNATSLANAYTAGTGRPVLIIPCANGSSWLFNLASNNVWDPSYPKGNKLRNSLYGSAVARLKNAIALGGTFRFIWHYHGESATAGLGVSTFAADTTTVLNGICADAGVTKRVVLQTISDNVNGGTAPNIAAVQAAQASLAQAGVVLVGPKNNLTGADGLHLTGPGCDQVGAAAAALALAQTAGTGWY